MSSSKLVTLCCLPFLFLHFAQNSSRDGIHRMWSTLLWAFLKIPKWLVKENHSLLINCKIGRWLCHLLRVERRSASGSPSFGESASRQNEHAWATGKCKWMENYYKKWIPLKRASKRASWNCWREQPVRMAFTVKCDNAPIPRHRLTWSSQTYRNITIFYWQRAVPMNQEVVN